MTWCISILTVWDLKPTFYSIHRTEKRWTEWRAFEGKFVFSSHELVDWWSCGQAIDFKLQSSQFSKKQYWGHWWTCCWLIRLLMLLWSVAFLTVVPNTCLSECAAHVPRKWKLNFYGSFVEILFRCTRLGALRQQQVLELVKWGPEPSHVVGFGYHYDHSTAWFVISFVGQMIGTPDESNSSQLCQFCEAENILQLE